MISKYRLKLALSIQLIMLSLGQGCVADFGLTPSPVAPTATETIALTAISSIQPTRTETAIATMQPATSQTANNQLDLSKMNVEEWAFTSPDGRWSAAGLVAFPKEELGEQFAYVRLSIFSVDQNIRWTVIDEWREIGLGFRIPAPLKWSNDDRYFYFTYRVTPDGCPVFTYLTDLQQVDLETGSVQDLLPNTSIALALSPDDSRVAYAYFYGQPQMGLALRDLTTGEERATIIDPGTDFNAGNLVWSPDGKSFGLTLAIHPCSGEHSLSKTVWAEATTILWVDAKTLEQKVLIQEDPRLFITVEWNEPNKILITDGEEHSLWHVDVNTGEITRP